MSETTSNALSCRHRDAMRIVIIAAILVALVSMAAMTALSDDSDAYSRGSCGDGVYWTLDDSGRLSISGTGVMKSYSGTQAPWGKNVKSVSIGFGVTRVGSDAFRSCTSLASASLSGPVTSIGDGAFYGCRSLSTIEISGSVASIGDSAFYGCKSLKSITIPGPVKTIGNKAFAGCTSLSSASSAPRRSPAAPR